MTNPFVNAKQLLDDVAKEPEHLTDDEKYDHAKSFNRMAEYCKARSGDLDGSAKRDQQMIQSLKFGFGVSLLMIIAMITSLALDIASVKSFWSRL
jgi:hypothetical protein